MLWEKGIGKKSAKECETVRNFSSSVRKKEGRKGKERELKVRINTHGTAEDEKKNISLYSILSQWVQSLALWCCHCCLLVGEATIGVMLA